MRFHTTTEFQAAKTAYAAAYDDFVALPDDDPLNPTAEYTAASAAERAKFEALLLHPAITPTELRIKLGHIEERDVYLDEIWPEVRGAIIVDLRHMQALPVSPWVAKALAAWRAVHEPFHLGDTEGYAAAHTAAFRELMTVPCTTPGDFMAKAYANLCGQYGPTMHGQAKADGTGNIYDIDIAQADDALDENEAWARSAYADLDASDLGANLLAYGLPRFSAEHWMERAYAVGMRISLIIQEDGHRLFGISEDYDDEDVADHVHRERDRLRRIWAFDKSRTAALADLIERHWPQLILRVVPIPAAPVPEKAA